MRGATQIFLAGLLFFLATLLSFWDLNDKIIEVFPFLEPYLIYLPYLILGILVLLTAINLFKAVSWVWVSLSTKNLKIERNLTCRIAKSTDLDAVMQLADLTINQDQTLPDETVSDLDVTKQHYNHCRESIHVVEELSSGRIVGYFSVLPLTRKGEELLNNRTFKSENGLGDLTNFCKKFGRGRPIYIGGIGSHPEKKRQYGAAVIHWLKLFVDKKGVQVAYARPATKDGVRLAKKNGFRPVNKDDKQAAGTYVRKLREEPL